MYVLTAQVSGEGPPEEWLNLDASYLVPLQFLVWFIFCLLFSFIFKNYIDAKDQDLIPSKDNTSASCPVQKDDQPENATISSNNDATSANDHVVTSYNEITSTDDGVNPSPLVESEQEKTATLV